MDLYVLNNKFQRTAYVEAFESSIWSIRYAEYGDFEIHVPYFSGLTPYLMSAAYVLDVESRTAMFVEDIEISTDAESGPVVVFKGRSLESILTRRIIWGRKTVYGNVQTIISNLISESIISPTVHPVERTISNFIFQSNSDERLAEYEIPSETPLELDGDNLYDIVKYLCDMFEIGFRVTLNLSNQFVFELYLGDILDGSVDRKKKIVFSPKFDNLSNTRYYQSSQNYKNVTLVASTYEYKAEQDASDLDHETEQTNDSSSAIAASVIDGSTLTSLTDGLYLSVKFHKKVTAGATLNVNGTGAKPIYYNGFPISDDVISGSATKKFTYRAASGGRWLLDLETYEITASTDSWVAFPVTSSELYSGLKIVMKFNKKVEANATLNINSTGAKPLWYKNAAIPAELIDGSTEVIVTYSTEGNGRWVISSLDDVDEPVEQRREAFVTSATGSEIVGLNRREIFTDASNISTEDGMMPNDYLELMKRQGFDLLRENRKETEIDGESVPGVQYIFGQDYQVGDIVLVENECGITASVRIIEYVQTIDENGASACPTFSSVYY